jgi:hypothetical protein
MVPAGWAGRSQPFCLEAQLTPLPDPPPQPVPGVGTPSADDRTDRQALGAACQGSDPH